MEAINNTATSQDITPLPQTQRAGGNSSNNPLFSGQAPGSSSTLAASASRAAEELDLATRSLEQSPETTFAVNVDEIGAAQNDAPVQSDASTSSWWGGGAVESFTNWVGDQVERIQSGLNSALEGTTQQLMGFGLDTLENLSGAAQWRVDRLDALHSQYEDFKSVAQTAAGLLPGRLGEAAQGTLDAITERTDSRFDALQNSLGRQVLELFADEEVFGNLRNTLETVGENFGHNPIELAYGITGPLSDLGAALFDANRLEERPYGEYNIIRDHTELADFLASSLLPTLLKAAPEGAANDSIYMGEPRILENVMADRLGGVDPHPNEDWYNINGIATTEGIAHLNASHISDMFGRPVDAIYNPTDNPLVDLLESGVGKTGIAQSAPAALATETIAESLRDDSKDRVVVTAHSQGSIIASNVLGNLGEMYENGELTAEQLSKLEIYTFANPADSMLSPRDENGNTLVHMEHFANANDTVAHLGVVDSPNSVNFDGEIYVREGAYGHLLGEHYLYHMETAEQREAYGNLSESRLFSYA